MRERGAPIDDRRAERRKRREQHAPHIAVNVARPVGRAINDALALVNAVSVTISEDGARARFE